MTGDPRAATRGERVRGVAVGVGEAPARLGLDPCEVLAIDDALAKLQQRDPQKARIVELRYYAGLTIDETADVLGVSPRLVDKDWQFARAWLHRELS